MKNKNFIIAIDGPAGAGKSTISKKLASKLNFTYIDTGAMYRAVTLYLLENNILNLSEDRLKTKLKNIKIQFKQSEKQLVFLNGKNVTSDIRSSKVASLVSEVAAKKAVREELVSRQKEMGKSGNVILDGRDIGIKVFPNANLKIYLTASAEIRAKRRLLDVKKLGEKVTLAEMIGEINRRDNYDSSRKISPLTKPQDAIVIDSSNLSVGEVLESICFYL